MGIPFPGWEPLCPTVEEGDEWVNLPVAMYNVWYEQHFWSWLGLFLEILYNFKSG